MLPKIILTFHCLDKFSDLKSFSNFQPSVHSRISKNVLDHQNNCFPQQVRRIFVTKYHFTNPIQTLALLEAYASQKYLKWSSQMPTSKYLHTTYFIFSQQKILLKTRIVRLDHGHSLLPESPKCPKNYDFDCCIK